MASPGDKGGNELLQALQRRRREVDEKGSQFTKDMAADASQPAADVRSEDHHESQFTPRSRHRQLQGTAAATSASSIEPADAAGGVASPAELPRGAVGRLQRAGLAAMEASPAATLHSAEAEPDVAPAAVAPERRRRSFPGRKASAAAADTPPPAVKLAETPPAVDPCFPSSAATAPTLSNASSVPAAVWRATVEGDVRSMELFSAEGVLASGRLMDANGHSIFWNAVAFQRPEAALWLLRRFPAGSSEELGVDLSEVHARRRDSLLHLCLYIPDFSAAAAEVFRLVLLGGGNGLPQAPRGLANESERNFLHIAAARLNFWALRFVLMNCAGNGMLDLFWQQDCDGRTPLQVLLRRVGEVTGKLAMPERPQPVEPPLKAQLPPWNPLQRYAPPDCCGEDQGTKGLEEADKQACSLPPFADVILEVEDRRAEGGVVRIGCHRVILASTSSILNGLLRELEPPAAGAELPSLRLDPLFCRSGEVLRTVLGFLYSGKLHCRFSQDPPLLWQLLCLCTRYGLPRPLTVYARSALLHVLGEERHSSSKVLTVLLQAVERVELSLEERLLVACVYLSNSEAPPEPPTAQQEAAGSEAASELPSVQALLAALAEIEGHALRALHAPRVEPPAALKMPGLVAFPPGNPLATSLVLAA